MVNAIEKDKEAKKLKWLLTLWENIAPWEYTGKKQVSSNARE